MTNRDDEEPARVERPGPPGVELPPGRRADEREPGEAGVEGAERRGPPGRGADDPEADAAGTSRGEGLGGPEPGPGSPR